MQGKSEDLYTKHPHEKNIDDKPFTESVLAQNELDEYNSKNFQKSHELFITYHPWKLFALRQFLEL